MSEKTIVERILKLDLDDKKKLDLIKESKELDLYDDEVRDEIRGLLTNSKNLSVKLRRQLSYATLRFRKREKREWE